MHQNDDRITDLPLSWHRVVQHEGVAIRQTNDVLASGTELLPAAKQMAQQRLHVRIAEERQRPEVQGAAIEPEGCCG
jgi:hypothetical protein